MTGGNAADADDLVQETLLKAMSKIDSFRGDATARTWLTTIMVNTHRSERRRASVKARYMVEPAADAEPIEPVAPARQESQIEVAETLAALRTLPEEQRLAIAAVAGGNMSYAEAAEALGVKLGTFMSRISRGRSALRRKVDGPDGTETKDESDAKFRDRPRFIA